jgi:hypothetical protein
VLLAGGVTALAALITISSGLFLAGGVVLVFAFWCWYAALRMGGADLQVQSDHVARWFSIGLWATLLNASVVLDLVVL